MAKYFVHNGTLNIEGKKMSKSLGNVVSLNDLLDTYHGAILRFTMLRTHYRQPIDWTKNSLEESKNILKKWISVSNKDSLRAQEVPSEFYETLLDDINTPQAITKMHAYFSNKEYDKLFGALNFLGINIKDLSHSMASEQNSKKDAIDETEVNKLIEERNSARKAKDYKKSDEIRNKLELMGIKLQDDGDKSTWEYINE
jgi:cysteinyl-tRNA synthetase